MICMKKYSSVVIMLMKTLLTLLWTWNLRYSGCFSGIGFHRGVSAPLIYGLSAFNDDIDIFEMWSSKLWKRAFLHFYYDKCDVCLGLCMIAFQRLFHFQNKLLANNYHLCCKVCTVCSTIVKAKLMSSLHNLWMSLTPCTHMWSIHKLWCNLCHSTIIMCDTILKYNQM